MLENVENILQVDFFLPLMTGAFTVSGLITKDVCILPFMHKVHPHKLETEIIISLK
jgi:hypothetical protein